MLSKIKKCFMENKVLYTSHAKKEMIEEEFGIIKEEEVFEAILSGEVIENYAEDNMSIIVTVYQPNPDLWYEYRRRKK